MKFLKSLFIATTLLTLTAACNDKDDDMYYGQGEFNSLVTYDRTVANPDGNISRDVAYFTFYTDDNNRAPIMYTATGMSRKITANPGDRVIIAYTLAGGQPFGSSGPISLITYRKVPGGKAEFKPTDEAQAANAPMALQWINRTANYINLEAKLMNKPNRTFTMIGDAATEGQATVELYVTTAAPADGDTGVRSGQIASFDIESIWRNPNTSKIRVHVNNSAGTQNVFEFTK